MISSTAASRFISQITITKHAHDAEELLGSSGVPKLKWLVVPRTTCPTTMAISTRKLSSVTTEIRLHKA